MSVRGGRFEGMRKSGTNEVRNGGKRVKFIIRNYKMWLRDIVNELEMRIRGDWVIKRQA